MLKINILQKSYFFYFKKNNVIYKNVTPYNFYQEFLYYFGEIKYLFLKAVEK